LTIGGNSAGIIRPEHRRRRGGNGAYNISASLSGAGVGSGANRPWAWVARGGAGWQWPGRIGATDVQRRKPTNHDFRRRCWFNPWAAAAGNGGYNISGSLSGSGTGRCRHPRLGWVANGGQRAALGRQCGPPSLHRHDREEPLGDRSARVRRPVDRWWWRAMVASIISGGLSAGPVSGAARVSVGLGRQWRQRQQTPGMSSPASSGKVTHPRAAAPPGMFKQTFRISTGLVLCLRQKKAAPNARFYNLTAKKAHETSHLKVEVEDRLLQLSACRPHQGGWQFFELPVIWHMVRDPAAASSLTLINNNTGAPTTIFSSTVCSGEDRRRAIVIRSLRATWPTISNELDNTISLVKIEHVLIRLFE